MHLPRTLQTFPRYNWVLGLLLQSRVAFKDSDASMERDFEVRK